MELWISPCLTTPLVPPSGNLSDRTWLTFLSGSEKRDKAISDGWKDDANGILVFVRLSPSFHGLSLTNQLKDRSFLGDCRGVYHRKL